LKSPKLLGGADRKADAAPFAASGGDADDKPKLQCVVRRSMTPAREDIADCRRRNQIFPSLTFRRMLAGSRDNCNALEHR
jgi:hypothetical protein